MQKLKDISAQITQALDKILPEEVRCAIVLVDLEEQEVSAVSNLTDESTISLLEEAVEVLRKPDEAGDLKIN